MVTALQLSSDGMHGYDEGFSHSSVTFLWRALYARILVGVRSGCFTHERFFMLTLIASGACAGLAEALRISNGNYLTTFIFRLGVNP